MIIKCDKNGQEAIKTLIDCTLKSLGNNAIELSVQVINALSAFPEEVSEEDAVEAPKQAKKAK